jgi:hypothetical protein
MGNAGRKLDSSRSFASAETGEIPQAMRAMVDDPVHATIIFERYRPRFRFGVFSTSGSCHPSTCSEGHRP